MAALPVIGIFGPTAVGKTELIASILAEKAEVVSADSMQVYKHLNIGTAKPSPDQTKKVPHHLIDIAEANEQFSVGRFVSLADTAIKEIWERGKIPILSGGTAFYFKTFIYGLPATPPGDMAIRKQIQNELNKKGIQPLYDEACRRDPEFHRRVVLQDKYRVTRALEIMRLTERPFSYFAAPVKKREDYRFFLIGLKRERKEIYKRINDRVDSMFNEGLIEEVKGFIARGYNIRTSAMQGIGYREFFQMQMEGCFDLKMLRERIKRNSRRYAKRQLTFFNAIEGVNWFEPEEKEDIKKEVDKFLGLKL